MTLIAQRVPKWARPSVYGGLYVGCVVVLRAIVAIAWGLSHSERVPAGVLLLVPAGFLLGAYMGGVGGLTFSVVRQALARRFGRLGDVIVGLLCVYAYMLSIAVPLAIWGHGPDDAMIHDSAFWVITSGFGLLLGITLAVALPRVPAK